MFSAASPSGATPPSPDEGGTRAPSALQLESPDSSRGMHPEGSGRWGRHGGSDLSPRSFSSMPRAFGAPAEAQFLRNLTGMLAMDRQCFETEVDDGGESPPELTSPNTGNSGVFQTANAALPRRRATGSAACIDVFPAYSDLIANRTQSGGCRSISLPDITEMEPGSDPRAATIRMHPSDVISMAIPPAPTTASGTTRSAQFSQTYEVPLHELDALVRQRHQRTHQFLAAIAGLTPSPALAGDGTTLASSGHAADAAPHGVTGAAGAGVPIARTERDVARAVAEATASKRRGADERHVTLVEQHHNAADAEPRGPETHVTADSASAFGALMDAKALADWAKSDLIARSTSLSCRNFFRSLDMRPASSSSGSDSDTERSTARKSKGSHSGTDAASTAGDDNSEDMRACADGLPRSAKQVAGLVKRGRTLPLRLTTGRGQTIGWTTLVTKYGDESTGTATSGTAAVTGHHKDDDDDARLDMAGRADLLYYFNWINLFRSPGLGLLKEMITKGRQRDKEVRYRALVERVRPKSAVEHDPFYIDDPSIVGEQRLKRMNLNSYCTSVLVFADKETVRNEIDQRFYYKFPDCERRKMRLTTIRRIKALLLQVALDHGSPIDLATVVHAVCYFERLIVSTFVDGENKWNVASVCLLLATKFYETGITKRSEMQRKIAYVVAKMDDAFGVDARTIFAWELKVLVALEFDLMLAEKAGLAYLVSLLATRNITPVSFFGTGGAEGSDSGSDGDGSSDSD
jgi:hypothetical protein